MASYERQATNVFQQIEILSSRGLNITNNKKTQEKLLSIGYFRFKGYCLPFYIGDDIFRSGVSFKQIFSAYLFDEKIKSICLDIILRIETQLKSKLGMFLAKKYGPLGYLNNDQVFKNFQGKNKWLKCIALNERNGNQRHEPYVKHYHDEYDDEFPIWVATEMASFGQLSKLYSNLTLENQKQFAKKIHLTNWKLKNWLHVLTVARNICAHGARMYAKSLPIKIKFNNRERIVPLLNGENYFSLLYLCKILIADKAFFRSQINKINKILKNTHENIYFYNSYGFPNDWLPILF